MDFEQTISCKTLKVVDIVNNSSDWPGVTAGNLALSNAAISSSTFTWAGVFGTTFILDTNSGYYILGCNMMDSFTNVAKGASAANLLPYITEA